MFSVDQGKYQQIGIFSSFFGVKSGERLIYSNGVSMLDPYLTVTNFISDMYM